MRLIDIEDSLEPKSDSQKLEFLTPLEGGINSDGDVFIKNPSTNAPIKIDKSQDLVGTANYAPTYFFRVASNVDNASIYLNGENTFKLTPDRLSISVDDVIPLETLRLGLRGDTFFTFLPEEMKQPF